MSHALLIAASLHVFFSLFLSTPEQCHIVKTFLQAVGMQVLKLGRLHFRQRERQGKEEECKCREKGKRGTVETDERWY